MPPLSTFLELPNCSADCTRLDDVSINFYLMLRLSTFFSLPSLLKGVAELALHDLSYKLITFSKLLWLFTYRLTVDCYVIG